MNSITKTTQRLLRRIRELFVKKENNPELARWKKEKKENLRYAYNLGPDSIVFDLGGYEGEWSSNIFSMYCPTIYVFEPVKKFFTEIKSRFSQNPKIKVFNFGLSKVDEKISINIDKDSSSAFKKTTGNEETMQLKKASAFILENGIKKIDLMKINIEGGEYDLLEDLIAENIVRNIENIQVQFHKFVPSAEFRMNKIRKQLEKTHCATYKYDFVWENWKLKL